MENRAFVSAVDYEGRGVVRCGGKAVFVQGALPGEEIAFRVTRSKKRFDEAETSEILQVSTDRVEPRCRHFGVCGGCVLQHASAQAQVAYKQRVMEEQLTRIGNVVPERILPPIYGRPWGYRQRARLGVGRQTSGRVVLGFRSRRSDEIVDLQECWILPLFVSRKLSEIRALLQDLEGADELEYVELLVGSELVVLNVRSRQCLSEKDLKALKQFSDRHLRQEIHPWQIWLQTGHNAAVPFYPVRDIPDLFYDIPGFKIKMPFRPGDFTQVNPEMNALLVERAMTMLAPQAGERIADLFCGLGNFTLPIAKSGAEVLGIEGARHLVERARQNAVDNGCAGNTHFKVADLFEITAATTASWGKLDKILLDPPRNGAHEIVKALHGAFLPKRIVYVSCNPATFARDAGVIIEKGYKFKEVGVVNLFPQTAHIESIGCFYR